MSPHADPTSPATPHGPATAGAPAPCPRCVALCPRPTGLGLSRHASPALPAELKELLAQRGTKVECCADGLSALAALVANERGYIAGAHRDPMLLILVEPSRLRDAEALVAAASKYAHHAAVWQYDPSSPLRLSRYAAPVGAASVTASTPSASPPSASPPSASPPAASPPSATTSPAPRPAEVSGPRANGASKPNGAPGVVARPGLAGGSFVSWGGVPAHITPGGGSGGSGAGGPAATASAAARGGTPVPVPGPKLRLTPASTNFAPDAPAPESGARPSRPAPPRPELTDEEVSMLLDTRETETPKPNTEARPQPKAPAP